MSTFELDAASATRSVLNPRRTGRSVIAMGLVAVLLGAFIAALSPAVHPAQAADNQSFDPGYIISDDVFFNKGAMTEAGIKAFFSSKDPNCKSGKASDGTARTCLKDFSMASNTRAANENCSAYTAKTEGAASIIYRVAQACGINPQVILVTLQKEQGFLTGGARSDLIYRKAMGMGCPDTSVCNSKYYGFFNQVYSAAWQLKQYGHSNSFTYNTWPKSYNIPFHTTSTCKTAPVYIRNQATAALYNYTPYQPNAAALAAGSGLGDKCSSYGNRNFWRYFSDWFGNPANLLPGGTFDGSSLSGWVKAGGTSNISHKKGDTRAQSGTGFIAADAPAVGRSITKTINRSVLVGQAYTASVWVRAESVNEPYTGRFVLTALGGTAETVGVRFTPTTTEWQQLTVVLPIVKSNHTQLRVQVIHDTAVSTVWIDTMSISGMKMTPNRDAVTVLAPSFESKSVQGWVRGTGGALTIASVAQTDGHAAQDGTHFMSVQTKSSSAAVKQEVKRVATKGESYTLTAWVRSAMPGKLFRGKLNLAAIGGVADSSSQDFLVGNEWERVSITRTMGTTHTVLRSSVFLLTAGRALEIDNVTLEPTLLPNPSFEANSASGWFESYGGALTTKVVTNADQAVDGARYLQVMRTGTAAARISSDTNRDLVAGDTYTVSGWLRSSSADVPYVTQVRLIARSAASDYDSSTFPVTVGPEWTRFETTVTVTKDRNSLRAEIMLGAETFPLEIDGLVLR
jgi:hypothetical protein